MVKPVAMPLRVLAALDEGPRYVVDLEREMVEGVGKVASKAAVRWATRYLVTAGLATRREEPRPAEEVGGREGGRGAAVVIELTAKGRQRLAREMEWLTAFVAGEVS